jgi:hypothetical protein
MPGRPLLMLIKDAKSCTAIHDSQRRRCAQARSELGLTSARLGRIVLISLVPDIDVTRGIANTGTDADRSGGLSPLRGWPFGGRIVI